MEILFFCERNEILNLCLFLFQVKLRQQRAVQCLNATVDARVQWSPRRHHASVYHNGKYKRMKCAVGWVWVFVQARECACLCVWVRVSVRACVCVSKGVGVGEK